MAYNQRLQKEFPDSGSWTGLCSSLTGNMLLLLSKSVLIPSLQKSQAVSWKSWEESGQILRTVAVDVLWWELNTFTKNVLFLGVVEKCPIPQETLSISILWNPGGFSLDSLSSLHDATPGRPIVDVWDATHNYVINVGLGKALAFPPGLCPPPSEM